MPRSAEAWRGGREACRARCASANAPRAAPVWGQWGDARDLGRLEDPPRATPRLRGRMRPTNFRRAAHAHRPATTAPWALACTPPHTRGETHWRASLREQRRQPVPAGWPPRSARTRWRGCAPSASRSARPGTARPARGAPPVGPGMACPGRSRQSSADSQPNCRSRTTPASAIGAYSGTAICPTRQNGHVPAVRSGPCQQRFVGTGRSQTATVQKCATAVL